MSLSLAVESLSAYILVFCRMGGMVFFNPLLARRNLPSQFKVALVLGITLLLTPQVSVGMPAIMTDFAFLWAMIKELAVGFGCGFIFQIFYYLLFTAGDVIDMGFGLSMAKAFDPGTNIQISMSGNFLQLLFVLYIFATDCHLLLIQMFASSYDIVGIGAVTFGPDVSGFVVRLFPAAFTMVMQLAMPFIAAAFVLELAMGILMKLVPQINVFVIHFQLKIILGFTLLFLFAQPMTEFLQRYIQTMFLSMQNFFGVV